MNLDDQEWDEPMVGGLASRPVNFLLTTAIVEILQLGIVLLHYSSENL